MKKEKKIHIKEAIKKNTVVHCETEQEAKRILGMAHRLGHKWHDGESYENNIFWMSGKSKTCYNLFAGWNCEYDYYKQENFTIITSNQIANLEEEEVMKSDKEIMKNYRLKQWYPSLPSELKGGMIIEFNGVNSIRWVDGYNEYNHEFNGLELNWSDFWELVEEEKPLFSTVDWRNKKVFSYNDIEKLSSGGEGVWYNLKEIAKERSEQ